ncbi:MAG: DNA methyltransferase [Lyngbya sp.]|nr:DNA methyltransferase [Lyngbya sp.]
MPATPESLQSFVNYCQQHLRGDEKSEAQTFLTKFFQAFGHQGTKEVGAEFEHRLTKGSAKGKTGFADLVWRSRAGVSGVLIEMKSKGENLSKHYTQLERYWMRIAPNRPRYAILCNFDEFWIFDFENQVDEPVDQVLLEQLPQRMRAFSFMEIGGQSPVFKNNQVAVTERTARRMGELYQLIYERAKKTGFQDFNEEQLQRFILQCVMAMFSEDRGLLPRDLFVSLVQDCQDKKGSSYDILGGLFQEMNRPGVTPAGRYKGVNYFNGGLFSTVQAIDLTSEELGLLDACARDNWSNVRPSIFGNIFEGAIDPVKRQAQSIHFTHEVDIRKIVRPTISDYWEDRINAANTIGELNTLQMELQGYRVLDPACGSGNFLYVAYQELKRIERLLMDKIAARKRSESTVAAISFVTPMQFFGMDTNPFAVQLAKVTMMIARKIAIDKYELKNFEPELPLDTLDKNIVCQDALFSRWVKADAVIGNPPFFGGKRMRRMLGDEYIDRVFNRFSDVKDSVDFCAYWFRLAHDHISETGRAGLVGTNSISQGKSRKAALEYITQNGGYIHEAISTQPWSGEANVHVSFVNWCKQQPQVYYLDHQKVAQINSSLTSTIDVSGALKLKANKNLSFQGIIPVGKGFYVTENQVNLWLNDSQKNINVLKPSISADDLTDAVNAEPRRWIIDFNEMSLEDASEYKLPFEHIKTTVKPERDKNRRKTTKLNWWKYGEKRPAMRKALAELSCYFAVPRHSKYFIFLPCKIDWLPADSTTVVASDDFYILGILTSDLHRVWVKAQKSTIKGDTRYTHTSCFETFPFPQNVDFNLVKQIRFTATELHEYRSEQMQKKQWGITQLYNAFFNEPSSQLYQLHAQLSQRVMEAYDLKKNDDILEKLFTLNQELAAQEKQGK